MWPACGAALESAYLVHVLMCLKPRSLEGGGECFLLVLVLNEENEQKRSHKMKAWKKETKKEGRDGRLP